jgi:hypothetical protein
MRLLFFFYVLDLPARSPTRKHFLILRQAVRCKGAQGKCEFRQEHTQAKGEMSNHKFSSIGGSRVHFEKKKFYRFLERRR